MPFRRRLVLIIAFTVAALLLAAMTANIAMSAARRSSRPAPTAIAPVPAHPAPLAAFPDAATVRRIDPDSSEGHFVSERIQAVLARNCYACHAGNMRMGGLRVDTLEGLLEGGFDDGPAVIPGDIHQGSLLPSLRHEGNTEKHMPPGMTLPPDIIADFTRWVADGAPWPRETPPAAH